LSGPKVLAGGLTLGGDPIPPDLGDDGAGPDPRADVGAWLREKGVSSGFTIVPGMPKEVWRPLPQASRLPHQFKKNLAKDPTLQSLFGPQDSCACTHCLSVLSPSAYYVDVLQFLQDAGRLGDLLARRPDLQDLELSCENTETPVPTIDLALEILENAAA